jgi:hypothetical protein
VSDGVNFAKDYQKDSYNKIIFIEKNIDDKNILATLKKHPYFFNIGTFHWPPSIRTFHRPLSWGLPFPSF